LWGFRKAGIRPLEVIKSNPALPVAGLIGGAIYYQLLKRLVIER